MKHTFTVKGMHCKGCAMLVQDALEQAGAKNIAIKVDEKAQVGTVSCEGNDRASLKASIEAEGYVVQ